MLEITLSSGRKRLFSRDSIVLIIDPGAIPGRLIYLIRDGLILNRMDEIINIKAFYESRDAKLQTLI